MKANGRSTNRTKVPFLAPKALPICLRSGTGVRLLARRHSGYTCGYDDNTRQGKKQSTRPI